MCASCYIRCYRWEGKRRPVRTATDGFSSEESHPERYRYATELQHLRVRSLNWLDQSCNRYRFDNCLSLPICGTLDRAS